MPKLSSLTFGAFLRRRRRRRRRLAHPPASPPLSPSSPSQIIHDHSAPVAHPAPPSHALNESSSPSFPCVDETHSLASFKVAERHASRECAICLEPLADNVVSTGQCLHLLHQKCLNEWLASSPSAVCPVCRHPLVPPDARSQRLCNAATTTTLAVLRDGRAWWWPEPWLSAEEARFERALHALWRVDAASLGPLPMGSTSPPLLREWMLTQIAHEWLNESAGHEWLQYEYMLEGVAV